MSLNAPQKQAVQAMQGRTLVLAGAGSGKTRVIVHKIAYLIEQGIDPKNILGLTFTNKAAAEMRSRLASLIGKERASSVTLATFHSFCMQILRKEIEKLGYTREFSLYDERDMTRVMQQLARDILGHEGELPSLEPTKAMLAEIESGQNVKADPFTKELHGRLRSALRAYNALSFDHLISLTIQLFQEHPKVLERYQDQFRYLMIDEYQDTNPAQFQLAELLSAKYQNLCVVGDDDQSIYAWRGAQVKNILHFKADRTIKLEQNYRSTSTILDAANAVIAHNKGRHTKTLWSGNGPGEPIEVFNAPTDAEEAVAVVNRMIRLKEQGLKWSDMAILYRSNALSRQFELTLLQASWQREGKWIRGIPYEIFGGLEFTERSEIKDLFAYLRVIHNPLDQEALLRIINVPRRGISDTFLDQLTQTNRTKQIPLWELLKETAPQKKALGSFIELMEEAAKRFQTPPLSEALIWLLEAINYKKAIQEDVKSEKMREFKWENVQECINAISSSDNLADFLDTATLHRQPPQRAEKAKRDQVHLMTFHSAKGLEFPACFLIGLEDGILPHEKCENIEEERRLFYVGITRAQRHLTLSMARSRLRMGKAQPTNPSRFLFEVPKHLYKAVDYRIV